MTQILLNWRGAPAACGTVERAAVSISKGHLLDLLLELRRLLQCWRARVAYRRDLARLLAAGPHLVPDLGLDTANVREEIRKAFWRA